MLNFFRKYQKIFFIFTTAIIVISFTFFGMIGSMGGLSPPAKEVPLVKAIDGSTISVQKVDRMVHFLSSSMLDCKDDQIRSINLLNDGIIEHQFLSSGFGLQLAEKISSSLENDVEKALEKAISFQTYRYPGAPFICSESVWNQFAPGSSKIVGELTAHTASLPLVRKFDLLSQGYLQNQAVPSGFIRKILSYQAKQVSHVEEDPSLPYADVSLLGLHSAKDWLGSSYLKAAAQVIINGAASAKREGLSVSTQEARESLIANLKKAAEVMGQEVGPQTSWYQIFLNQVRNLGMNEPECLDLWKDIALFRKLIQTASYQSSIDPSISLELENIVSDQALVEKFSLPSSLQFRDFTTFMKLQVYIDAVSAKKRSKEEALLLPTEFLSLAEIEKKAPDLIQREYVLEYAELDLSKMASEISLKETWNYQMQEEGWNLLKKEYSSLSKSAAMTKEERFAALEAIDSKERGEIDKWTRQQILSQDRPRIQKELELVEVQSRSFAISSKGIELPFKGIADMKALVSLLEFAPLKGEKEVSTAATALQETINFYTGDGQHYYKICVVERSPLKKIQTFAEANASGALRSMLDKKLENAYFEVRKKDSLPYMKKDGSWKSLADVREKVGLAVFASALKAISAEYQAVYGKEPLKEQLDSPEFYAQNWMLTSMKDALVRAKTGIEEKQADSLTSQWQLTSLEETLVKKEHSSLSSFVFEEGAWSSILSLSSGKPCFFKVIQKLSSLPPSSEEVERIRAPLKRQAEKKFFDQLFSEIEAKRAFSLKDPA